MDNKRRKSFTQSCAWKIKKRTQVSDSNDAGHTANNMNIRGVFLHVLADALGSIAILLSTLLVKYVKFESDINWKLYIDPALSIILTLFIIASTIPLLKESSMILLQTVPSHIDLNVLRKNLNNINGVLEIHDFHVWSLNPDFNVATLHLRILETNSSLTSLVFQDVRKLLHQNNIHSTTLQIEYESDGDNSIKCVKSECTKIHCCNKINDFVYLTKLESIKH